MEYNIPDIVFDNAIEKQIEPRNPRKKRVPTKRVIKCEWCGETSEQLKFHLGYEQDIFGTIVVKTICPKCTNVFHPNNIRRNTDLSKFIGVVIEENISEFCRENHDPDLFKAQGRIPNKNIALSP